MSRTHVITFATDLTRVAILQESARRQGFEVTVLSEPIWEGYHQKLLSAKDYVQSALDDDDLLLFVDAYDVIFTQGLTELERVFRETGAPLIFGAEINCWPGYFRKKYWFRSPTRPTSAHKYLNSGFYIGTKKGVLDFLQWKSPSEIVELCADGGDQVYAHVYFLDRGYKVGVDLDHRGLMVLNMHHVRWSDLSIREGRLLNNALGVTPTALHFNGGSFRDDAGRDVSGIVLDAIRASGEAGSLEEGIPGTPAFHKGNLPLSQTRNVSYSLFRDKVEEWRAR